MSQHVIRSTRKASGSPATMVRALVGNRDLIWQMTKREVVGRYRGSVFGLLWSFFNPVLMLAVYTFAFSVVLRARWHAGGVVEQAGVRGHMDYALNAFAGLILFSCFAECIARAPTLIVVNSNYVKRVVFPLETLPVVTLCSTLIHALISVGVLLLAAVLTRGGLPWTVVLWPVVVAPFALFVLGVAWFLASLGTYLRDVAQTVGIVTMVMLYLSPIFYSLETVPAKVRPLFYANPLTFPVEQARAALLTGRVPGPWEWAGLGGYAVFGLATACLGFFWFQKTKKGFADVL